MKITPIILLYVVLLSGCIDDAPRDNPLDPQAPGFAKKGSLTGRLLVANVSAGIVDATVTSMTEHVSVQTDALGYFSFPSLPSGIQKFICTKTNFIADTFSVMIQTGQTAEIFRNLNGAPATIFKQILTRKIDQYFPGPEYFVEISAVVTDPNGGLYDLDSVWFVAVDTIKYPLKYDANNGRYITTIYKIDIQTNTIQWLVGKPLTIIARDKNFAVNASNVFYVTRVIEQTAVPILSNIDSVNTAFELKWTPPDVTFNYSYTVTLSQVNGGILKTYNGILSFNESLVYPYNQNDAPLEKGNYVWSVTIVDDFGNYSRSKESTFTVK